MTTHEPDPHAPRGGRDGAHGDRAHGEDHDGAVRPFPSEATWLELDLPHELAGVPAAGFVDRVVEAVQAERALDAAIDAEDRQVGRLLLSAHEAPPATPGFVDRTVAAVHGDRRARWQQLLARHVAPEPSPQFVARTLQALADGRAAAGTASTSPGGRSWRRWRAAAVALVAAAAAAVWIVLSPRSVAAPFEARVAMTTSPAFAHATASPLAALVAERARTLDPDGLVPTSADGTWLLFAEAR